MRNYFRKRKMPSALKAISMSHIDRTAMLEMEGNRALIDEILAFDASDIDFLAEDERAFPGNADFIQSGYYIKMLKRYLFAGKHFCKGKSVLDSCSGVGWGTRILSHYAQSVTAFDLETKAIDFSRATWNTGNVSWCREDALNLREEWENCFDAAVGMETIEHFNKPDGHRYVQNIARSLKPGGVFVGTSHFPVTRRAAEKLCKKNPYHLLIYTQREMSHLLNEYFDSHVIVGRWMFVGIKK